MHRLRFILCIASFAALSVPSARALSADTCPKAKVPLPGCSYTTTNGNCTISIDRMKPVTPPTIYVHRGCSVTVNVTKPSPFENLTLDWKSSTNVIPPDVFQTVLTAVTPNLAKLTVIGSIQAGAEAKAAAENAAETNCEKSDSALCDDSKEIGLGQQHVNATLEKTDPLVPAHDALQAINDAAQPLALGIPNYTPAWEKYPCTHPGSPFECWKKKISSDLDAAVHDPVLDTIKGEIALLQTEIDRFKQANSGADGMKIAADLQKNQDALTTTYTSLDKTRQKLSTLAVAISKLQEGANQASGTVITDASAGDKSFYQTQVWTLDDTNTLTPLGKRFTADPPKTEDAVTLAALSDVPTKTALLTLTVQFQSPSRVEVSSGVMVPVMSYHGYTKAAVANNGVVSDNVVQETLTYAVIPMAFINVMAKEWTGRASKQRSAFLFTNGVGYNPANSMVEFGSGLTFSYRSMALSFLADIGRDTKLGGGFTVGQSLGPTNAAANPITMTIWRVKPAIALSVRIPLGGGSSSSK